MVLLIPPWETFTEMDNFVLCVFLVTSVRNDSGIPAEFSTVVLRETGMKKIEALGEHIPYFCSWLPLLTSLFRIYISVILTLAAHP